MAGLSLSYQKPGHEFPLSSELFRFKMNFKGCRDLDAHSTPRVRIRAGNLVPKYLLSPMSGLICSNLDFHDESTESRK